MFATRWLGADEGTFKTVLLPMKNKISRPFFFFLSFFLLLLFSFFYNFGTNKNSFDNAPFFREISGRTVLQSLGTKTDKGGRGFHFHYMQVFRSTTITVLSALAFDDPRMERAKVTERNGTRTLDYPGHFSFLMFVVMAG